MVNDMMIQQWDDRYGAKEYAYGEEPNNYLREKLSVIATGRILFPAEGEGRNAVYAAGLGWTVDAFDLSEAGQRKAMQLAAKHHVSIHYQVGEFQTLHFLPGEFDAIALIYAHFPAAVKSDYHRILTGYLKPGGLIIFEAFSKNHLAYRSRNEKVGGPKELDMLFSIDEIKTDFLNFDVVELMETEVELNEGLYHNGIGSVIRFVGRKR